jgi:TPR repeat protein
VPEDNVAAIAWYTRAAEHGDAQAQNNLGAMYDAGEGTSMDDQKAVHWYTLSANQGNTIAQNNLGAMYYSGEGTKESKLEAYKWFYIAGELGNDDAGDNKELAAKEMRKTDVRKATKLAMQWLKEFSDASPDL